jgi:hypothetical protein
MNLCQERVPKILDVLDECLNDVDPSVRLEALKIFLDRGFGKPRQHVMISEPNMSNGPRMNVYIPDNGRPNITGPVIDG